MDFTRIIILSMLLFAFSAASSEAGWLVYHEPAFKGQILDVDTKQPVEGAVVVVEYRKETLMFLGGGGGVSSIFDVRETLTDKDGKFHIPSYTAFVDPLSWKTNTVFLIFKPGYVNLDLYLSDYLSGKNSKHKDFRGWIKGLTLKFPGNGVVELPSVKSSEDRLNVLGHISIPGPENLDAKVPILIRVYNEERVSLGLNPTHTH